MLGIHSGGSRIRHNEFALQRIEGNTDELVFEVVPQHCHLVHHSVERGKPLLAVHDEQRRSLLLGLGTYRLAAGPINPGFPE